MLSQEQIDFFRANGFLNYGRVLTDEQLDELRQSLTLVLQGRGSGSPDAIRNIGSKEAEVTQIVNVWEAEPAFRRHLYNSEIATMAAQLMGTDTIRVWHDQMQLKPPRTGGPTRWHQDHPYWPIIQPADLVSAWVALEDATVENGAMSMVPGSHLWGDCHAGKGEIGMNPETYAPDPDPAVIPPGASVRTVPCEVPAGGVVFHHCLCWHGAPPNHSERPRPAIAIHYMPGWTRYMPEGKTHLVEQHITVAPGEILTGEHFPTVLSKGKLQTIGAAQDE